MGALALALVGIFVVRDAIISTVALAHADAAQRAEIVAALRYARLITRPTAWLLGDRRDRHSA